MVITAMIIIIIMDMVRVAIADDCVGIEHVVRMLMRHRWW